MALDENLCEIFRNNDIEPRIEFSLSELNKDDETLLDAIFPQKEESLRDLFKTRPFTGEIDLQEKITKEKSNKEKDKDEAKEIPEYFTLSKIKELLNSKLPPEIDKDLNQKVFLEQNIQQIESEIDEFFWRKIYKKLNQR